MALLTNVNSGATLECVTVALPSGRMTKEGRRAKVTPETRAEAARLRKLWGEREPQISQAEFGELFEIGNQSVVSQFLRGTTPLSLKAAKGFAAGLGCNISDFSPRLAAKASSIAELVPSDSLPQEVRRLAQSIAKLHPQDRAHVLAMCNQIVGLANRSRKRRDKPPSQSGEEIE